MSGSVRRPGWWWKIGVVIVAVALGGGYLAWDLTTDSLTGPAPSVSASDSCGGGAPSVVLAFKARTGLPQWSARIGEASDLELADDTVTAIGPGGLRTLNVADGSARWCSDDEPNLEVVAAGNTLVSSRGESVVGRRASDGKRVWTRPGQTDWIGSDGTVAVVQKGFGSDRQTVRGLDPASGREVWRYTTAGADFALTSQAGSVRADGLGLTFVHDGLGVVAAGATDGEGDAARWTSRLFRPIGVSGERVVGGVAESFADPLTRFTLEARTAATGVISWRHSVPGFDARVVNDVIVVINSTDSRDAPDYDGSWYTTEGAVAPASRNSRTVATGYDPADGTVRWQRKLPFAAQIHAAGDVAVVWVPVESGNGASRLIALDPATGKVRWRANLPNPSRSEHFDLADQLDAAVYDQATDTLMVLVRAGEPYEHSD